MLVVGFVLKEFNSTLPECFGVNDLVHAPVRTFSQDHDDFVPKTFEQQLVASRLLLDCLLDGLVYICSL